MTLCPHVWLLCELAEVCALSGVLLQSADYTILKMEKIGVKAAFKLMPFNTSMYFQRTGEPLLIRKITLSLTQFDTNFTPYHAEVVATFCLQIGAKDAKICHSDACFLA